MDLPIILILLFFLNHLLLSFLAKKFLFLDKNLLQKLFLYHLLFFGIYYLYAQMNRSDSFQYYFVANEFKNQWAILFETSSKFISFIAVPLVRLGVSYDGVMLVFSWFGYVGFVYAYLFFRENIPIEVKIFKRYDLLTVLLFLPNMHFWTVSLGKGSVIFMGLMLFTYAVKVPLKRIVPLILGGFLVYMVRPHVMLFMLVGVMIGLLFGKEKISLGVKFLIILASIGFLVEASSTILGVVNLQNSENVVEDFSTFSETRSYELSKSAGSSVDMNNYPLPLKLFTFWFRPLFVDSPNSLGVFSSLENLIYLLLFAKILKRNFIQFIRKAPYMVKMSAIVFLLTSFAMTFIMSNLGIIMRQKSMVMYFGFFVIYYFLAQKEFNKRLQQQRLKEKELTLISN